MTVARRVAPNYTTQLGAAYKGGIDAAFAVDARFGGWFAPHQVYAGSPNPDLAVELDAGFLWNGSTLLEIAAQTVTGFTVPSAGQNRVDRVVVDASTGVASRVAGTAVTGSPSAVAPAIPAGKIPICQVLITSSDTAVTDSAISDERVMPMIFSGQLAFPATQNPSSDANTLDDYEEGTWTPADGSGAALSLTNNEPARYTKIGRLVGISFNTTYPVTADGSFSVISGLPFQAGANAGLGLTFNAFGVQVIGGTSTLYIYIAATNARATNANCSTNQFGPAGVYSV